MTSKKAPFLYFCLARPNCSLRLCYLLILTGTLLPSTVVHAQSPRVVVVNPSNGELRRAAHRLRISPEHLLQARQALERATDVCIDWIQETPEITGRMPEMYSLPHLWTRLNRPKAASQLVSILEALRARAARATSADVYRTLTEAAQPLVGPLCFLDLPKARQIVEQWPPRPKDADAGSPSAPSRARYNELHRALWLSVSAFDPDAAWASVNSLQEGVPEDAPAAYIAQKLLERNRRADAEKVIDETLRNFGMLTTKNANSFSAFLAGIGWAFPDRFERALVQALPLLIQIEARAPSIELDVRGQKLHLTPGENLFINTLRSIQSRPDAVARVLSAVPELRSKLDAAGGIDYVLNPEIKFENNLRQNPYDFGQKMTSDLVASGSNTPAGLRAALQRLPDVPDQFLVALSIAQSQNYNEPELSHEALEVARTLLMKLEPLSTRAEKCGVLLDVWLRCEGEIDNGLLQEAWTILSQLRKAEAEPPARIPETGQATAERLRQAADQFEITAVVYRSAADFSGALQHVNTIPDAVRRFRALIRLAEVLSSN
ncbi:MAG TPA: hypothetical protein VGK99_10325 [Acidobacteriota bacterium]